MLANVGLNKVAFGFSRGLNINIQTHTEQLSQKQLQADTVSFEGGKKGAERNFIRLKNQLNPNVPFNEQLLALKNAVKWDNKHTTMFLGCPNDKLQAYATHIVNYINQNEAPATHYKLITIDIVDVMNDLKKQNLSTNRNFVQTKIATKLADILNDSANNNVAIVLKNFQELPENKDVSRDHINRNSEQPAGHLWHQEMIFSKTYPYDDIKKMLVITAYDRSSNDPNAVQNATLNATLGNQMSAAHFLLD